MSPLVGRRLGAWIIALLLVVKIGITIGNQIGYGARVGYDATHHAWRSRSGGLEMGKMAYNPPLYYMPALPSVDLKRFYKDGKPVLDVPFDGSKEPEAFDLENRVRGFNIGYLTIFYVAWIYLIFPRVLPHKRSAFLASLFLLALPGFQKSAAMTHPDNLLMALSAVATAIYVHLERLPRVKAWHRIVFALAIGLAGITRPFAIVPVFFLWLGNSWGILRENLWSAAAKLRPVPMRFARATGMMFATGMIVAVLASAWWVFRYVETGELLNAYRDEYMEPYQPLKQDFPYQHYYTSFHFKQLLDNPNRDMSGSDQASLNPYGNTFATILYSEVWGDHWLYFTAPKRRVETKDFIKRPLFVAALPFSVLTVIAIVIGYFRQAKKIIVERAPITPMSIITAIGMVGFALFVWWQGHAGLLPGKNSTIKFLYISWVVPYSIATALSFKPRAVTFYVIACYLMLLYAMALPIALFRA